MKGEIQDPDTRHTIVHAPAGVGTALLVLVGVIVGGGLYLLAVRGDALFLDLAALSGMLFCF
jgi:hypothetical protein